MHLTVEMMLWRAAPQAPWGPREGLVWSDEPHHRSQACVLETMEGHMVGDSVLALCQVGGWWQDFEIVRGFLLRPPVHHPL